MHAAPDAKRFLSRLGELTDDDFTTFIDTSRQYLDDRSVADENDLKWWLFSGHRPNLGSSVRDIEAYFLYKVVLHYARGGEDTRRPNESVAAAVKRACVPRPDCLFGTIRLSRTMFSQSSLDIREPFLKHRDEWLGTDPTISWDALESVVDVWRELDLSLFESWFLSYFFLDRVNRVAFLPLTRPDRIDAPSQIRFYHALVPCARMLLGESTCELCAVWTTESTTIRIIESRYGP